jgi:hypothetical protein
MGRPLSRLAHVPVALLATLAWAAGCASNSTPERSFATRAEAQRGGGFDTGWLPDPLVPPSGKNIRARRDLHSNQLWARFEFEGADRGPLGQGCSRIGQERLRLPASETRGIGWWPEMLRSDPGVAVQQFEIYACGADARLAVHRSLDTAFYWRAR